MEERELLALQHIKKILRDIKVPPLEGELAEIPLLQDIHGDLTAIRETLYVFSEGDISSDITVRGIIPGCLKALQAHLRHMIWQVQMVAQGDFSQQIHFLGEFSAAFNGMVSRMDLTLKALREKEAVLTALTNNLRNEVDIRSSKVEALQESESRFKYLASHDPLTGALNRRAFMERTAAELKTAALVRISCGMVMLDIDHFKIFNDTWGHQAGDEALRHVVNVIGSLLRKNDFLGRYGGEEFVIFLNGTDRETAGIIAERVREAVASHPVKLEAGPVTITASFGVDIIRMEDVGEDMSQYVEALIRNADVALYQAKAAGRNRVISFTPGAGGDAGEKAVPGGPPSDAS